MSELRESGIDVFGKTLRLLIFALVFISSDASAQIAVDTPRTIRVVMDNNYAPYVFPSDEGRFQGILIDQWQAWEKKTGIKVDIHAMDWSEALQSMRAGNFDVIDCIVETADRQDYFNFTTAYNTVEASIYFRNDISGISDLVSLKGFPIGVKTGDQHIDKLKASGVTNMVLFHNNDAIIGAAKKHMVNVFLMDDPSALYLLNKVGMEPEFRHTGPIFRDQLRRAVRKGDTTMLRIVSDGFAAIEPGKLKQINEKWFGRTINNYGNYVPYLIYAVYAVAVAILLIAGLAVWNRTLSKRILLRTAALRQSEDRIRLIIDTIPIMAWSLTPDGIVDFLNQRWIDYTGLSLEQYIKDPTGPVHPEDIPRVMEKWLVNKAAGKAFDDEMRLYRADGEYRWFLVRTAPLRDEQGNLVKWYGASIDIEESKRAQDELRLAYQRLSYHVENTPLAVIELDKDLFIKRWSKRAEEIFGWRASEALGKNVNAADFPLIYIEDIAAVDKINKQLTKGVVNRNLSLNRNYTKDGNVIYSEWYNSVLRDEQGNAITILSLIHNVTERKKAEETLQQSYEEIRRLTEHIQKIREEERVTIAREIHDELGQQLTVLTMEVKGLNKKLYDADEGIKQEIGDIIDLLDSMVKSVRRISSELRPSLLYNLGLAAAIEWHLKEFEKRSGTKTIFNDPKEELELPDSIKKGLFRIFQESLTNVSRHANANKVNVILEQKGQQLFLSIEDNGQGFEKENIAAKDTLGILGMKERSEMMGGNYEIISIPGKGTTVIIAIPYNGTNNPI